MREKEVEIVEAKVAFEAIVSIAGDASIDLAWSLDDLKEALKKYYDRYISEQQKLYEKHGTVTGKGKYTFTNDNFTICQEAIEAMGKLKVKVAYEPLNYNRLIQDKITISPGLMFALKPFIIKLVAKVPENEPERKETPLKKEVT